MYRAFRGLTRPRLALLRAVPYLATPLATAAATPLSASSSLASSAAVKPSLAASHACALTEPVSARGFSSRAPLKQQKRPPAKVPPKPSASTPQPPPHAAAARAAAPSANAAEAVWSPPFLLAASPLPARAPPTSHSFPTLAPAMLPGTHHKTRIYLI